MSAQDYTSEVLQKFYGPIAKQGNAGLPQTLAESIISEAIKNLPHGGSGDDSQRLYLHKNEAPRGTWLERGAKRAWGDSFLPKTRNACKNKALSRSCSCEVSGLCENCYREGVCRKVFKEFNEYNNYRRFIVLWGDEVEHAWILIVY